jgi:hypothetical protein
MAEKLGVKSQGHIWVFFNVKTQEQSKPLPHSQAHLFILKLAPHEMRQYVVWTPGWEKWLPLKEMLHNPEYKFEIPPPPVGGTVDDEMTKTRGSVSQSSFKTDKTEKTYTEIELSTVMPQGNDEFAPEKINWDKTPVVPVLKKSKKDPIIKEDDRRQYKRFPHRIELVLMTKKGKSFRSSSVNVSIGGALLREAVPAELLRDVMDLLIINPFPDKDTPSHLLMKGRVVGDSRDLRRLIFYDVSPEVQVKLKSILERYQNNYREHKKKKAS